MLNQYDLHNQDAYLKWRESKLNVYPASIENLLTAISDPEHPTNSEIKALSKTCQQYNMALYRFTSSGSNSRKHVHHLSSKLGLKNLDQNICADEDQLTSIEVRKNKDQHTYIPYTKRKLSWHTDGYYNNMREQIFGMLLHCARPAFSGGKSLLLDHEIAYILLRDENPEFITALFQPDAMTIPPNILKGKIIRPSQTGPIFSFTPDKRLHMRYSARLKNIEWKENTLAAAEFLQNLWKQGSPYIIKTTLNAGEGVVCNNVLHCRTAFEDAEQSERKRLFYRGRYFDHIK